MSIPAKLGAQIIMGAVALGVVSGVVTFIHHTGHTHERKIMLKKAGKAEGRADDAVGQIGKIQTQVAPAATKERETIIRYDRTAAVELGKVKGQLDLIRSNYAKLEQQLREGWGDTDLPDDVRLQLDEIDKLISGL
ncbi:MAG: hypothetical protein COA69_13390 [Robiginitomaculum sp.]|nr:MAG: hypothetical protein COA69_13390 [Robiginitomaculum sp.]